MSDFSASASYDYVTLVDRTGKGGCEIIHDGVRIGFPPGKPERPVPQFLVNWLFRVDQQKVHTTDGQFVQRFGVKEPSEEMVAQLGIECGDISPIEIDTNRAEGWDTDQFAVDRGSSPLKKIDLARRPSDYANVGGSTGSFGKER